MSAPVPAAVVLPAFVPAACIRRRQRELTMKLSKLRILGSLVWLIEALWIVCYGRFYNSIDWYHYYHIAIWGAVRV
jgi:hypothetical protein